MRTNCLTPTCRRQRCMLRAAVATKQSGRRTCERAKQRPRPTSAETYRRSDPPEQSLSDAAACRCSAHDRECQQPSSPVYAHKLRPSSLSEPLTRQIEPCITTLACLSRDQRSSEAHASDFDQAMQLSHSGAPFMRINRLSEWPTRRASATSSLKYKYRPVEFQRSKTGVKIGRRNHCSHSTKRRCRQKHDRHASRCRIS